MTTPGSTHLQALQGHLGTRRAPGNLENIDRGLGWGPAPMSGGIGRGICQGLTLFIGLAAEAMVILDAKPKGLTIEWKLQTIFVAS